MSAGNVYTKCSLVLEVLNYSYINAETGISWSPVCITLVFIEFLTEYSKKSFTHNRRPYSTYTLYTILCLQKHNLN